MATGGLGVAVADAVVSTGQGTAEGLEAMVVVVIVVVLVVGNGDPCECRLCHFGGGKASDVQLSCLSVLLF